MASLTLGPAGHNPNYAGGEKNWAFIVAAQTAVLARGRGSLHSVIVGVAGTLLKFYDCAPGGTTDVTTQIATVSAAAVTATPMILDVTFSLGLTCIATGASVETTVSYVGRAAPTKSPHHYPVR